MKILDIRAIRGANYYSRLPVIFIKVDIEELEFKPTDVLPDFKDRVHGIMPSLFEHTCSPGIPGGFYERLERGTWAGHVAEHIAIELQCLAGHDISFEKTFSTGETGVYNIVYRYKVEKVGLRAGEMAIEIVTLLFNGIDPVIEAYVEELKEIFENGRLGPSTQSIVTEASIRGVPWFRLNEESYVQLGTGKYQRRIQATMTDNTSAIGVEIAEDKFRTKHILSSMGIPVPQGKTVYDFEECKEVAFELGYPVVVKPVDGNHGRGVTVNINTEEELKNAYDLASGARGKCLVEKYITGTDFRVLVINGKFVAAAKRDPAFITGDGQHTVTELIDEVNSDPERGEGHEKNLTKIEIDEAVLFLLKKSELNLESVPEAGRKIYLKHTANLSSGGTATDVTDLVHVENRKMFERIAGAVGLNIMGIDVIAQNLRIPMKEAEAGIVEVNVAPGFRMHLHPSKGDPRNIATHVMDMLFPPGSQHSVPICAVTGTNGKTTTVRLISHMMEQADKKVGMTTTDGVYISGTQVAKGDYSGPEGARLVFSDTTVEHAVLEVARGGILRRGLPFKDRGS